MARVSEAVNSGEDLVLEDDAQEDKENKDREEEEEEEKVLEEEGKPSSGRDVKILSNRLDKTEQSLDSLGRETSTIRLRSPL